jgi:DNA mismatch repair protein MutL
MAAHRMRINVLPQTLINQIAAGEVVVNMASVIKELVENSLDAGATSIVVELSGDLRDAVVTDDGCGMERDDAEMCLQRHATSKIRDARDLFELRTRGFRGEALPSIASVSRVEIVTRPAPQLSGTRLLVEGGAISLIESAGCPPGTRIAVRELFFNTPARRKFLKTSVGELNAVTRTLVRQALAAPDVGIRLVREGEELLDLPRGQGLADRFESICGGRVEHGLLEVEGAAGEELSVSGLVAQPMSTRGDRRSQYLFVNGRPFSSKTIAAAIEQAGRGFVMVGRFPIYCLFIGVAPGAVDFNVHPTKEEVRFENERAVASACYHAVRAAYESAGYVPDASLADDAPTAPPPPAIPPPPVQPGVPDFFTSPAAIVARAFERKRAAEGQRDWLVDAAKAEPYQPVARGFEPALDPAVQPARGADETAPPAVEPDPLARRVLERGAVEGAARRPVAASSGERPDHVFWQRPYDAEVLGQIARRYIVARYGEDLLVIDQHAAHERLRFLELAARSGRVASQPLLVPVVVEAGAAARSAVQALVPHLRAIGFDLEPSSPSTWQVTAVPADLARFDVAALLLDVIDDVEEVPSLDRLEEVREKVMIRAACHSSIRGGDELSTAEMSELLRLMRRHRLSFTCPHGRPTIVRLSLEELDKLFKRIV